MKKFIVLFLRSCAGRIGRMSSLVFRFYQWMSRSANRLSVMSIKLEGLRKPEASPRLQVEIKMPTLEERFERILKDRTYYRSLDEDEAEPKEPDKPEPEPEEEEAEGEIIFEGDYLRGRRRWKEILLDMIEKGEERRTVEKDNFHIRDLSNGRMKININSENGWCGMHAHIGGSLKGRSDEKNTGDCKEAG